MKIRLTEEFKQYFEKLDSKTKSKLIITEDTIENKDEVKEEELRKILFAFYKEKARKSGEEIRAFNAQLQKDHPEYFE